MSEILLEPILEKYICGEYTSARTINTMVATGVGRFTISAFLDSKLNSNNLSYNAWISLKRVLGV